MRDQFFLHPFGRISIRSFLLFISTFAVIIFASLFAVTSTAYAAGEAKWSGDKIIYQEGEYVRFQDIQSDSSTGLPVGTKVYINLDNQNHVAKIIYFPPDSDPSAAKKATYIVYKFTLPASYSSPSDKAEISFSTQSAAESGNTTSCVVEGIGWIVCPVTNFLSKAMDWLFGILSSFLNVRPVQTDQGSALYRAWSMMRNFANIAFVIAFMVVIYSQLTNFGLSNYGIKRTLPRLILAAILVNISYWICAVGVDLSNIAGYSIQDIFTSMRNSMAGSEGNGWDVINWESIGSFILSGGTAAGATGVGLYVFAAGAGGAIYMLIPILLGVLVAALVALLVMAARQALITILIIVSPLAFVAFLLPNTEKYFKKWHELLSTMLLVFPMFAVIFSGSQLAGEAIIQNADSLNLIILGMGVKIAPVAITPFLMKLSGSLLSRVAGVVNNPGKGLIDRSRNFAKERADQHKARALANHKNPGRMARSAQSIDARRRKRSGWQKANEARADAEWAKSQTYSDIHAYDARTSQIKEIGENKANRHIATMRATDVAMQNLDIDARVSKIKLDGSQARVEANWDEFKAGDATNMLTPVGVATSALAHARRANDTRAKSILQDSVESHVQTRRAQSAQNVQHNEIANAMHADVGLQIRAGGIDSNGAQRALAEALKKQHEIRGEAVKTAASIIDHMNVNPTSLVELSLGNSIQGITNVTDEIQEAAIKMVAGGKDTAAMQSMFDRIDVSALTENQRISLSGELLSNGSKPKYITAGAAGKIAQDAQPLGVDGINELIKAAIDNGKYSAGALADQDKDGLTRVLAAIKVNRPDQANLDILRAEIDEAMTNKNIEPKLGDERKRVLRDILQEI